MNGDLSPPPFVGARVSPTTEHPQLALTDYVTGLDELYENPGQTNNNINDPAYDLLESNLRGIVSQLRDCEGFQTPASASVTDCNVEWVER